MAKKPTYYEELEQRVKELEKEQAKRIRAEEEYKTILRIAMDGFWVVDIQGRFLDVNKTYCNLIGYSREELLTMAVTDVEVKESKEDTREHIRKVMEISYDRFETRHRCKDGSIIDLEVSTKYMDGTSGKFFSFLRDITERIQAEEALRESEEKYRTFFDESGEAIAITTRKGKFVDINQAALDLFGYTREQIVELNFRDLCVDPDTGYKFQKKIDQKGSVRDYEVKFRKKDGTGMDCLYTATLRRANDGRILGYQGIIRDITEEKLNKERLERTLRTLRETTGGTIKAMAQTVEVRDPYTAGHQWRVADLARFIMKEMGFSQDQIDGIRMAGVIHDIGKISVPAEILSKPGRLTDIEFSLIKTHSQVGHDILKMVDFPWPIAQIVLQHHERMDGSGYPQGLTGVDTLPEARILAVADVVEAMVSHRPYRPALGVEKALEEISEKKSVLYDPNVADTCLKVFTEEGFKFRVIEELHPMRNLDLL